MHSSHAIAVNALDRAGDGGAEGMARPTDLRKHAVGVDLNPIYRLDGVARVQVAPSARAWYDAIDNLAVDEDAYGRPRALVFAQQVDRHTVACANELLDLLQLFSGVFVLLPLPLGQGSELRRPRAG